jgi:hypothetical protein
MRLAWVSKKSNCVLIRGLLLKSLKVTHNLIEKRLSRAKMMHLTAMLQKMADCLKVDFLAMLHTVRKNKALFVHGSGG